MKYQYPYGNREPETIKQMREHLKEFREIPQIKELVDEDWQLMVRGTEYLIVASSVWSKFHSEGWKSIK